ncbi:hypothetical protein [Ruminiclostridium sufflavum]|uniref:hypothetical protein n=1 Tax=Ruminiclostridium sufflavum TaxID=396504 RepID=UPI000D7BB756|nr:hypothetical protein [Ruminiclostridium sufflavum]
MSNSIVFQNSAEQLKTAIYGYNSSSGSYKPLSINEAGELLVNTGTSAIEIGTINKVLSIETLGTVNKVSILGTINQVSLLGTLSKVAELGTINQISLLGTLSKVSAVGTLSTVEQIGSLGTVGRVAELGTINQVSLLGTLSKVSAVGTLSTVEQIGSLGTVGRVAELGTINQVSLLGTLSRVLTVGTLNTVAGTVKINLADRTFTSITQTLTVSSATSTYSNLINIAKYQDTSWYFINTSATNKRAVTVQLAVTPSTAIGTYPRTLIFESATVNASPRVITNDYYLEYISAQINNTSSYQQDIVAVFNGRY